MKKFTILSSFIFWAFSVSFADDHSDKLPVESDYYPITTIPLPEGAAGVEININV